MKRLFLLMALMYPLNLFSAQYPTRAERKVINDFSIGLYNSLASEFIPEGSASSIWNWMIDEKEGSLTKPGGYVAQGTTGTLSGIYFMKTLYRNDGSKEYILSDNQSVVSTQDFRIYKPIRTGLNGNFNLSGVQARGKMWFTNGNDSVFTYDGSTVTVLDGGTYNSGTAPNVPRGKHIEYWDGRIWIYNRSSNDSELDYSATNSTSGASIAPDHELAWPTGNNLGIGIGDGQQGTFLKISNGRLVAGKERSIYSIESLFGSGTLYFPRKTSIDIGFVSNESVIPMDNVLYGQGENGIYAYERGSTQRMTDHILEDVSKFRKDVTRILTDIWEIKSDFDSNGQYSGSTSTLDGLITIFSTNSTTMNYMTPNTNAGNVSSVTLAIDRSTSTTFAVWTPTFTVSPNFRGGLSAFLINAFEPEPAAGTVTISITIRNSNTGRQQLYVSPTLGIGNFQSVTFSIPSISTVLFSGSDINSGNLQYRLALLTGPTVHITVSTTSGGTDQIFSSSGTYQYISKITTVTASAISSWNRFDSIGETNGGNIRFYYKTATSAVNIATYPWIPITAGSVISSSATDNFIQWAATMTVPFSSSPATVDQVTIEHLEGNSARTKSFSAKWKNRLWIAISTESAGNFPIVYVKNRITSKNPSGWTRLTIPLRSMLVDGDIFYGGDVSTGTVYRLDYGTNYNGSAIPSQYDTKSFSFSDIDPFTLKQLWEYQINIEKNGNGSFSIGTSKEGGAFNFNTFSYSNSGKLLRTIKNVNGGKNPYGKQFRFRFQNNNLDETPELNSFSVIFKPTLIRN